MLFSGKPKVGDLSARESHRIEEHRNNKICAAMEVLVYGAEKVFTIKHCQFQVCLNTIWLTAAKWSDADCQLAIE